MSGLEGLLVAVSIGDAPDRLRLGFPKREIERALLSTCMALVRAGADVAYGGNLDPTGFTFKISKHLSSSYASARPGPFHFFIPEPEARTASYDDLLAALNEGRGTLTAYIARGDVFVPARPRQGAVGLGTDLIVRSDSELAVWFGDVAVEDAASAHSRARQMVADRLDARVILGGKMGIIGEDGDAYQGAMPGIAEEAILTLERHKPLITLGAFGGAARDVAIALDLIDEGKSVPRGEQLPTYLPAMERVAALKDRIPDALRGKLSSIADDDRSEPVAFEVVGLIESWRASAG